MNPDPLPDPDVEQRSLRQEAWREANNERWYQSETAGHDVGAGVYEYWVRKHWAGFVFARWVEHLSGRRYWIEFGTKGFAIPQQAPAEHQPLLEELLERYRRGEKNLTIMMWALKSPYGRKTTIIALLQWINILTRRRGQIDPGF